MPASACTTTSLVGIIEYGDANVIVRQAFFHLGRDLPEHFFGVKRCNRMAGDGIQKRKVPRFALLLTEETRIFNGDGSLAGQHAQHLQMPFVENSLACAVDCHHADGVIVQH